MKRLILLPLIALVAACQPGSPQGDEPADARADEAEAEGGEDAEVLLAGLDEPGERSDDEAGDEESDHVLLLVLDGRSGVAPWLRA